MAQNTNRSYVMEDIGYYTKMIVECFELKLFLSTTFFYVSNALGVSTSLLVVYLSVVVIDFILGVFTAWLYDRWDSNIFRRGVSKLFTHTFITCAMLYSIDLAFSEIFYTETHLASKMAIGFIVLTEMSSILQHAQALKMPIPDVIILVNNGARNRILRNIKDTFRKDRREEENNISLDLDLDLDISEGDNERERK